MLSAVGLRYAIHGISLRTIVLLQSQRWATTAASATSDKSPLILTAKCIEHLKQIDPSRGLLRVLVDSGGCSGFQYNFDLSTEVSENDRIIEQAGVRVVVDDVSLELIRGATIEYEEELIRSGFRVMHNPQADKGCSCGVSFALKMD